MNNKRKLTALFSMIIMVVALVITLVFLTLPDDKRFMSPILLFFFLLGIGFGIMAIIYGIVRRFSGYFFLSSIPLVLTLTIALIVFAKLIWWAIVLCDIVLLFVITFFSIIVNGNKTEEIALNEDPEYKTYKQKELEKSKVEDSNE